jgi:hypothetical protein
MITSYIEYPLTRKSPQSRPVALWMNPQVIKKSIAVLFSERSKSHHFAIFENIKTYIFLEIFPVNF